MTQKSVRDRKNRRLKTQSCRADGLEAIMGTRQMNGPKYARKSKLKGVGNQLSPCEKSSQTAGIPKSPLDQKQRRGRKEFREMQSGTGSSRNSCSFTTEMERR